MAAYELARTRENADAETRMPRDAAVVVQSRHPKGANNRRIWKTGGANALLPSTTYPGAFFPLLEQETFPLFLQKLQAGDRHIFPLPLG